MSTKPLGTPSSESLGDWVVDERVPFVSGEEWERSLRDALARWAHVLYADFNEEPGRGE